MKISLDTKYFNPYKNITRQSLSTAREVRTSQNFDGITLSSSPDISSEKAFADSLSSRILLEIKKPASSEKISNLQSQVEQGTYEADINAIVDRIMLS